MQFSAQFFFHVKSSDVRKIADQSRSIDLIDVQSESLKRKGNRKTTENSTGYDKAKLKTIRICWLK